MQERPTRLISIAVALVTASLGLACSRSPSEDDMGASDAWGGLDARVLEDAAADASAPPDAVPRGADNGGPCASSDDCRSPDHPAGFRSCLRPPEEAWTNGYCRSFCTMPAMPQAGAPIERRDCPTGSVCLPTYRSTTVGFCLRGCTADSDCRVGEGYYCRRDFAGVHTTSGVCAPMHCKTRGCAGADCSC